MGYAPPPPPFEWNLDRHGMPLDYATYEMAVYGKRVDDRSPARLAFLNRRKSTTPPSRGTR